MKKKPAKVCKGDQFSGLYMGTQFSGVVTCVESNASGYACDRTDVRVWIALDAPITYSGGVCRMTGEELVMSCDRVNGGLVRTDIKFSNVKLRKG
jgi:hypothetical protein